MTLEEKTNDEVSTDIAASLSTSDNCDGSEEQTIADVDIKTPDTLAADACADLRKTIQRVGKSHNDLQSKKNQLDELSDTLREVLDPEYSGETDPYAVALDRKNCQKAIERLENKVDSKEIKTAIDEAVSVLKAYRETL